MIRKLVERFNESLKGYLSPSSSARRKICVPVTISIEPESINLRRRDTGKLVLEKDSPSSAALSIKGKTVDLSENGLAFIVSSVRLGDNYLVGQTSKPLNITLDLPGGKVCLQALGQRYEPIGDEACASKYMIGAKITRIGEKDRRAYNEYLEHGYKAQTSDNKKLSLGITK